MKILINKQLNGNREEVKVQGFGNLINATLTKDTFEQDVDSLESGLTNLLEFSSILSFNTSPKVRIEAGVIKTHLLNLKNLLFNMHELYIEISIGKVVTMDIKTSIDTTDLKEMGNSIKRLKNPKHFIAEDVVLKAEKYLADNIEIDELNKELVTNLMEEIKRLGPKVDPTFDGIGELILELDEAIS